MNRCCWWKATPASKMQRAEEEAPTSMEISTEIRTWEEEEAEVEEEDLEAEGMEEEPTSMLPQHRVLTDPWRTDSRNGSARHVYIGT